MGKNVAEHASLLSVNQDVHHTLTLTTNRDKLSDLIYLSINILIAYNQAYDAPENSIRKSTQGCIVDFCVSWWRGLPDILHVCHGVTDVGIGPSYCVNGL